MIGGRIESVGTGASAVATSSPRGRPVAPQPDGAISARLVDLAERASIESPAVDEERLTAVQTRRSDRDRVGRVAAAGSVRSAAAPLASRIRKSTNIRIAIPHRHGRRIAQFRL
jgi:hypothetical protein